MTSWFTLRLGAVHYKSKSPLSPWPGATKLLLKVVAGNRSSREMFVGAEFEFRRVARRELLRRYCSL